jgi:hypothetical protein
MNSEDYLNTRIKELENEVGVLKTKLKGFNALGPKKWVAWQEGYDAAHHDIQTLYPSLNPYREE